MKTKLIILLLLCLSIQNFYAQKILFTKGTFYTTKGRRLAPVRYTVNGNTYQVPYIKYGPRGIFNYTNLLAYYIGYDSLNPYRSKIYYNLPYFDATKTQVYPATTSGKIISVNRLYCEFQFYALNNLGSKKLIIARQTIYNDDVTKYNIQPGVCLKVEYLPQTPEASIIYYNQPAPDNDINYKSPALSKPNGLAYEFETDFIFTHTTTLNHYLNNYKQAAMPSVLPSFMANWSYCYKSGFWWSVGYGGAHKFADTKLGIGYMYPITKRFYVNLSTNFNYLNYSRLSFATNEIANPQNGSQYTYNNWFFNPKIDLMWRLSKHNNTSCSFLKFGAGVLCNLNPNRKWIYETAQTQANTHGAKGTQYFSYAGDLNNLPPFSNYMVYLSVGISLNYIRKP